MAHDRMMAAFVAVAALAAAGAANAQTAAQMRDVVFRTPARSAAGSPAPVELPAARSEPPRAFGVAKTAIDHRFDRSDMDGSVGFLCGLQPKAHTDGAAAAYGVDPNGRFLGVKLHLAFR